MTYLVHHQPAVSLTSNTNAEPGLDLVKRQYKLLVVVQGNCCDGAEHVELNCLMLLHKLTCPLLRLLELLLRRKQSVKSGPN